MRASILALSTTCILFQQSKFSKKYSSGLRFFFDKLELNISGKFIESQANIFSRYNKFIQEKSWLYILFNIFLKIEHLQKLFLRFLSYAIYCLTYKREAVLVSIRAMSRFVTFFSWLSLQSDIIIASILSQPCNQKTLQFFSPEERLLTWACMIHKILRQTSEASIKGFLLEKYLSQISGTTIFYEEKGSKFFWWKPLWWRSFTVRILMRKIIFGIFCNLPDTPVVEWC